MHIPFSFITASLGRLVTYLMLIYEAKQLSSSEKSLLREYDGSPNHQLTKHIAADSLIKKGLIVMSTQNRALFSEKGDKIKAMLEKWNL